MVKRLIGALGAFLLITGAVLAGTTPAQAAGPGYFYAGAAEAGVGSAAKGISGKLWIANPYRQANSGEHTLMEVAAKNTTTGDSVEVGWVKDGTGAGGPRLFIYYNVAGVAVNCYYGCASWVDNAANPIDIGADLTTVAAGCNGSTTLNCVKPFTVQYFSTSGCGASSTSYWFYYDSTAFGCLPGSVMTATTFDEMHAYSEVYYGGATVPCTDAGNGKYATAGPLSASGPSFISSISYTGTGAPTPNMSIQPNTDSGAYTALSVGSPGNRSFAVGGPGRTSTGATPGNLGSC